MLRSTRLTVPSVALSLLLAGCGGNSQSSGGTSTAAPDAAEATDTATETAGAGGCENSAVVDLIEEVEGLEGKEREDLLVARAAEAGGNISLYTEMSDAEAVLDLFDERYGDLDLELSIYRAGSEQVRQRILEESAVGFAGADLLEIEALEMVILGQEGILAPSSSPWADEVVEAGQFDTFTADRFSYILPLWNTDKISEAPESFEDFASDKYAGQMALEDSDVYWFAVLVEHFMEQGMSKDEAVDVFKRIAANSTITHGHTTTAELVVAGQHGITPNAYLHRAMKFENEGAPVGWKPVNVPVVAEITAVSVVCTAANPAGALLLQDFFLDPEGAQAVFAEVGRTPANKAAQAEQLGGVEIEPIRGDVERIVGEYSEWAELWDEVIRGQGG